MGDRAARAAVPGIAPTVVAIGGGHGLSATLRAVRRYAGSVTAVVSVADDGGSSGRLRLDHPGLPAPGDVRRCLGALAAEGSALGAALEHRFPSGDLAGHALGNLVLAERTAALGSFTAAVDEVAALIGAVGRVLPATDVPVALEATRGAGGRDGRRGRDRVVGQVAVQATTGITEVRLRPAAPGSPSAVSGAILGADQVLIGPGSLFTSVLAAAVVPAVRQALVDTGARRVYVANLAPQVPETEGFTIGDELAALARHGVPVDVVVADRARLAGDPAVGIEAVSAPLADPDGPGHDAVALAGVLAGLLWPAVEGAG